MKFNFPIDKKTETLNISIYEKDIKKIRKLAELKKCTINDIYKTIISEALEEYEEKFGALEEKESKKNFSIKRDVRAAGDGLMKEVEKVDPDATYFQAVEIIEKKEKPKKLEKDWYKKEVIESKNIDGESAICPNPKCHRKHGKFAIGTGETRGNIEYCSIRCADKISPIRQPLPQNFVVKNAYCHYILCPVKGYNKDDGIEVYGKNFCSNDCYERFTEDAKNDRDISMYKSPGAMS